MCCCSNNKRTRTRTGNQPGPALGVLAKMAFDKYQDRRARNLPANRASSPSSAITAESANGEILEKAGVAPPSYSAAVAGRDDEVRFDQRWAGGSSHDDHHDVDGLSDKEGLAVRWPGGAVQGVVEREMPPFEAPDDVVYGSRREQRKVEKAAQRLERKLGKAERASKGCCA